MNRSLLALLCTLAFAVTAVVLAPAYAQDTEAKKDDETKPGIPEPDPVTLDWQFDFDYGTPDTIGVKNDKGGIDWYWYQTYKVTNLTEDELFFDPNIVVQNDAGKIIKANVGVDVRVFNEVRKLLENPLLKSPEEVGGKMFKGEEFARESVAIWKVDKDDVDAFNIFYKGIYGETKKVIDPESGKPIQVPVISVLTGKPVTDKDGNPVMQDLLVTRTRMLQYETPGTTERKDNPVIKLKEDKDVMR